jgi:hypothetical protein
MKKFFRHLNNEPPELTLNPSNKTTVSFLISVCTSLILILIGLNSSQNVMLILGISALIIVLLAFSFVDYLAVYRKQRCIVTERVYFTGRRQIREHINVRDDDQIVVRQPRVADNTVVVTFDSIKKGYPLVLTTSWKSDVGRQLAVQIAEILSISWCEIEDRHFFLKLVQKQHHEK